MRFLPFISVLVLMGSCASPYKKMRRTDGDAACILKFKPQFESVLYRTRVDVAGRQISGLLLIKTMPDSSIRLLFSNEIGFKFFDFGFSGDSGFKVYYVLKQLDKKPVIKTLRKDFELLLMWHITNAGSYRLTDNRQYYQAFPQQKGINYYITDSACSQLLGMQRASGKKAVVEAVMLNYRDHIPDTVGITHKNFNFTIALKRVN